MLSMEKGLVFPELSTRGDGLTDSLTKDKPVELFPVFMAPGDGVKTVELFMPQMTVAIGIPVVEASAVDYSVDDVLAKAELDEADPGPFAMNSIVLSADGSSDTKKNEKSTTVTVDGDVTFETDSDQLSAQADAVLANVVEQIKKYPSGGDLTITGHADDVADDAHNQDLSERRAKAVSDRLKKLTDLSTWKESVSGKGESAPRVPNDSDEHRQVNRRVEITLTPSKPSEAAAAPRATASASSGVMPTPAGPVGKGAQGVDVTINNKTVHMSIDGVTRVGEYLTGTLMLTASEKVYVNNWEFLMPSDIKGPHSWDGWMMGVYNLTLLSAGQRYLGVDYSYSDGSWVMLSNDFVFEIQPGEATRFPVVWPDTGEDSVTLDLPAGGGVWERVAARLSNGRNPLLHRHQRQLLDDAHLVHLEGKRRAAKEFYLSVQLENSLHDMICEIKIEIKKGPLPLNLVKSPLANLFWMSVPHVLQATAPASSQRAWFRSNNTNPKEQGTNP